jgi:mannose-1-phosphate guanylyltransferase
MKALLLAAGEGKRLRPLTNTLPKPMVRVAGRPILEYNIRALASYGVRDIVINLHHRPETITSFFGNGSPWGVSITYSNEPELLGTAGALVPWVSFFNEPFFVIYGDNITTCDFERLLAFHHGKGGLATIALYWRDNVSASGVVDFDTNGRIQRFVEKPRKGSISSHWINAGILVLDPRILQHIPDSTPSDFGHDVFPALLAQDLPVYGYRMDEKLWWIDTMDDYLAVSTSWKEGVIL